MSGGFVGLQSSQDNVSALQEKPYRMPPYVPNNANQTKAENSFGDITRSPALFENGGSSVAAAREIVTWLSMTTVTVVTEISLAESVGSRLGVRISV